MTTIFKCRGCRRLTLISDKLPGETVRCSKCGASGNVVDLDEIGKTLIHCEHCGAKGIVLKEKFKADISCPKCHQLIRHQVTNKQIISSSNIASQKDAEPDKPVSTVSQNAMPPTSLRQKQERVPGAADVAASLIAKSPTRDAEKIAGENLQTPSPDAQTASDDEKNRGKQPNENAVKTTQPEENQPILGDQQLDRADTETANDEKADRSSTPKKTATEQAFEEAPVKIQTKPDEQNGCEETPAPVRCSGKILKYLNSHETNGLIQCEAMRYWFHRNQFREKITTVMPRPGTIVTFLLKTSQKYPARQEAYDIVIEPVESNRNKLPLYEWAYIRNEENVYRNLAKMALPEDWGNGRNGFQEYPFPILFQYFHNTFARLQDEDKIVELTADPEKSMAAFNTGLVDKRYEPIFALFEPNPRAEETGVKWQFRSFCIAGERDGRDLVRYFNPLPEPPHYFENAADLIYDVSTGIPAINWEHILLDNIDRLPKKFLEQCCGRDVLKRYRGGRSYDYSGLRRHIKRDKDCERNMIERLKSAVSLAVKKVRWNYKTAIPQYNTRQKSLELLLPLCLVSSGRVDLALVVEKTDSGRYFGKTILTPDWAYNNARLLCRLDGNWLIPKSIH